MNTIILLWSGLILQLIAYTKGADPIFDPSTRMRLVLVPADAAVDSVIYRLRASDEEIDYPLKFELVGGTAASTVKIESLPCTKYNSICQANVVLTRRLEPGRYYDFKVSVKDTKGGIAVQSCSIAATNFTTPHDVIFPHKPGIVMIPEDAKRGTELDYVIARKNPLFVNHVLLELWGSPLFAIRQKIATPETTEGTVFLLGPLDFETQSMHHLTLLALDAYAEPGQDTRNIAGLEVVVIVVDVQDVPPIFTTAPPVTRLPAGLLPGDKVLHVHAEDGDKGNPREIRYGLVSEGNPFTSFFDINDTTGEIFLLRPLDEISAITHIGDPVLLTVIAEEVKVTRDEPPAMASTVQLAFFLPERSNSAPYFENDHYVARVDENAPQGAALVFSEPYVSRVYDDDTGKNGVFSLTLLGNNGTFEISPNVAERRASFIIYVRDNHLLDFESRQSVQFQILAQELGPATNLSATVTVTVYINDVNDNAPVFDQEMYVIDVPENITAGTKVTQVHATDVDMGLGGRVRYTQILGYLNTSLMLNPETGLIVISTNNHGFDREQMPEYHLYVEARDNNGMGNSAQVPLILRMIDVNDNAPLFDKSLYEFILSTNLRNFTSPAYVRATDADAEEPNNVVRYEIINGNYENKFKLDKNSGQLMLMEPLFNARTNSRRGEHPPREMDTIVLTIRAYDLGVPVMFSTATIRIYPPESKTRTVTFVVPGRNPDRTETQNTLSALTGGRVIIQDIRDHVDGDGKEKSLVTATVIYDSESVVDVSQIQHRLAQGNATNGIIMQRDAEAQEIIKAENKVLFWLLIILAILITIILLTLLLCCLCPWCPFYNVRKRVIRAHSTEDDVHLVHRELDVGKQTKSVQVAEWMGRREAWSAERSSDSRTKPTHWEFRRRDHHENVERNIYHADEKRVRSADDKQRPTNIRDIQTAKETQFHNSRTNLIAGRDAYVDDINEDDMDNHIKKQQIDDDSMRRHEIDRGSEAEYRSSFKRKMAQEDVLLTNRDQYFIKDGNAEILRLITRGKNDEENIYVNIPPQPQYIMVENGGKEILMKRFIDDQSNGKQIVREHYQIVPSGQANLAKSDMGIAAAPHVSEIYLNKSQAGSAIYSQLDPNSDVKIIHTNNAQAGAPAESDMQHAYSSQSLVQQELENSLKQQNALLRQILLEKEKLQEKYHQQETALETQSLPGHATAIATQTDCEAGTQTDRAPARDRRRARSENDDSMTEDDEYIQYSPPNSPQGVYWIKRKKPRRRYKNADKSGRRVVMVDDIKRKIRTPIKEENEDNSAQTPPKRHSETKTSILRRLKNQQSSNLDHSRSHVRSAGLKKDILMEISDSFDDRKSPAASDKERRKHFKKMDARRIQYYEDSEDEDSDEIVIRRNNYSADSLEEYSDDGSELPHYHRCKNFRNLELSRRDSSSNDVRDVSGYSGSRRRYVTTNNNTPSRLSRRDSFRERAEKSRRESTSEPPPKHRCVKGPAPKPPTAKYLSKAPTRSEADLVNRYRDEMMFDPSKSTPRYMEWYYNKGKESDMEKRRLDEYRNDKEKNKVGNKKMVGGSEKRIKAKASRLDETKYKPEPLPRTTPPPKGQRMLKEDMQKNKEHAPKIQTDANHPLLQYSEHRYEHEYNPAPDIPMPPVKLPHYMYPETPPMVSLDNTKKKPLQPAKPKPSPIHEHIVKQSTTRTPRTTDSSSKQLNASTLEDDHDSGIAMNSLLHSLGKRNPIADKKSVFTIAYDEATVKKIQSESDSPQFK